MNCFKIRHGIIFLILLVLLNGKLVVAGNDGEHDNVPEQSLNPGMSLILVFFISMFFLAAFTSLCIRQCNNHRFSLHHHHHHHHGTTSRSPSLPRQHGLDPAVVNTFPTFLYSEVKKHKIGQLATLECAVCLLEFQDDDILRLLPECFHVFHPNCIDAWLVLNVTCPLCRANLYPKPGELIISHLITTSLGHRNLSDHRSMLPNGNGNGFDSGSGSDADLVDLIIDMSDNTTPELINTPNRRPPISSTPMRLKSTGNYGKFCRSYSTGHLFVQAGENRERFTLRLPENVRSQLMNRSPSGSSPAGGFLSTLKSPRKGYRSSSVGTSQGNSYGWNIRMTPPSLSQASSVRSVGGDDLTATSPKNLMKKLKSPLDRLLRGTDKDDAGERSTRRLISDHQV